MSGVLVVAILLVGVGAWVQGSVGFGMNLLAAPLLVAVDPRFVPGPLLVAAVTLTAATVVRDHRSLRPGEIGWAYLGRVPGSAIGALAVGAMSREALGAVIGVVVLLAVVASGVGAGVPVTRPWLAAAGLASGFSGTATSVGGPPMALLLQHRSGEDVRGNLAGFFLLGATTSIVLLWITGSFGVTELRLGLLVAPAVLVGFAASTRTRHHVDGDRVRPAVLTIAAASGVVVLVRTLT